MHGGIILTLLGLIVSPALFLTSITPNKIAFAEFQISDVTETFLLNSTHDVIEVRLVSNQSAIAVLSVMLALNSTEYAHLAIREIKVYDHLGNTYTRDPGQSLSRSNKNLILDDILLPSALPAGGAIGIIIEISNSTSNAMIDMTFVYGSNTEDGVCAELTSLAPTPYDVVESHQSFAVWGISEASELEVDNSFTDPEIHCETCTRVEYHPSASDSASAAYVVNSTDLGLSQKMTFWVMGEGEALFNIAGKRLNQTISYEEGISMTLDREWRHIEVDLSGSNLSDITHLFGFSLDGAEEQTFYLKAITFS